MGDLSPFAKMLIGMGALLILMGLVMLALGKIGGTWRLPGDIFISKGNFRLYFPLATSILLSLILTVVLNLFFRR